MTVDVTVAAVCATIIGLALIARWFPWSTLRRPDVEGWKAAIARVEGAVTALQDSHVALKRGYDAQLYELDQQVIRITRERGEDRERFEAQMVEVKAEKSKLSQMVEQRGRPRFG